MLLHYKDYLTTKTFAKSQKEVAPTVRHYCDNCAMSFKCSQEAFIHDVCLWYFFSHWYSVAFTVLAVLTLIRPSTIFVVLICCKMTWFLFSVYVVVWSELHKEAVIPWFLFALHIFIIIQTPISWVHVHSEFLYKWHCFCTYSSFSARKRVHIYVLFAEIKRLSIILSFCRILLVVFCLIV